MVSSVKNDGGIQIQVYRIPIVKNPAFDAQVLLNFIYRVQISAPQFQQRLSM